ncbi:MAG: type VI secretion system membrane subunit TssM [Rhizobiaceae bacterium]
MRLFGLLALGGFAAAVWYAGPLISFDGQPVLEPELVRLAIIGTATALVAAYYGVRYLRARSAQRKLEAVLAQGGVDESDASELEARMADAVTTLKRVTGRRSYLYELPWYVIIGPPGAGKTTALVNSGLNFPLAGSGVAQPVSGVGGTRYCDWWFTDEAVLIDTAGRYTTQDSDQRRDSRSWLAFLSTLKRYRPTQPLNGVILAFSIQDLITLDGHELGAHVSEIRNRLREIHETLKVEFPVYVLFTKADLANGFAEFFGDLDEGARRQIWGATFASGEVLQHASVLFDTLSLRLSEETTDRLAEADSLQARNAIFGFASQFDGLKEPILNFLKGVFEPARPPVPAILRGFYFSSGTQEGTPIDRFLGTLGRAFGGNGGVQLSGAGKSFFLHDLLAKVVFGESGLVSSDPAVIRRTQALRYASMGAIAAAALAFLAFAGSSFLANRELVSSTGLAVEQYRSSAGPLLATPTITETDFETIIGALDDIRGLPAGYDNRSPASALEESFRLGQRDRLVSASEHTYRAALERLFRPRLLLYLERTIEREKANALAMYEPLRVYLTLGGKSPRSNDELVVSWFAREWQTLYPGAQNRTGREQLELHLRAMLSLDDAMEAAYDLNQPLIEGAQRSLGQLTLAERAAAMMGSSRYAADRYDFGFGQRAGSEAPVVLETLGGGNIGGLRVAGLYTYAGFKDVFLAQLSQLSRRLVEETWVMGSGGGQVDLETELLLVGPELVDAYGKEFVAAWNKDLDRLKFKPMADDSPDYLVLSAAANAESPIVKLMEAIAAETALTHAARALAETDEVETVADGLRKIGIVLPGGKSQSRAGATDLSVGRNPGAAIEAQFRPYQEIMAGQPGRRPIDSLSRNFRDIYQSFVVAASATTQSERIDPNLQLQISNLRTNASRLPRALARMVGAVADELEGGVAEASTGQLAQMLTETVTGACDAAITDRYPFSVGATQDVSLADFSNLFAPGGLIDRFFAQNLSVLADTSGSTWQWRQDTRLGRELSQETLRSFQRAAEIRDAFFSGSQANPAVTLTITPFSLHGDADVASLEAAGQVIQSYQTGNSTSQLIWPGDASGTARLTLSPELPGRESAIGFEGAWALKRLFEQADFKTNGDRLEMRFLIGGRDVAYMIATDRGREPLGGNALSSFRCPRDL